MFPDILLKRSLYMNFKYFEYARLGLGYPFPETWQQALDLYGELINTAQYGSL